MWAQTAYAKRAAKQIMHGTVPKRRRHVRAARLPSYEDQGTPDHVGPELEDHSKGVVFVYQEHEQDHTT